jgi:O-antigen ligase
MGVLLVQSDMSTAVPKPLRQAGFVWLAFIVVTTVSLRASSNILNGIHNVLEAFVLPPLLVWGVIARFDVRRQLPAMHTAVCISSVICASVAAAEIVTGEDLLPNAGSAMFYAGGGIPRPNGPFASNDALALIGAVSLFFLLFLRSALGRNLSTARRVLHFLGLAAAIGMALMPMFRSVAITLLLLLIVDTFWERGTTRRLWRVTLIAASAALLFMVAVFVPQVFEDRSSAYNVYGRVAQFHQSLQVFLEHPLLGIGFESFHQYVAGEPRYVVSYEGVQSVDTPHNNLTQVLAETGILGFVPYFMAHVLLFRAMWRLRLFNSSGHLAWKYLLYLFLTYWITGLSESSGYSPLNLWYMFAVGVPFKYALTDPDSVQFGEALAPDEAFSPRVQIA